MNPVLPTIDAIGTVLVTGGSSGLGAAVADAVAAAGGTPVVLDLKAPDAGHAFVEVDLADTAAAQSAVARVIDEHGGLDGVQCGAVPGQDAPAGQHRLPHAGAQLVAAVERIGAGASVHDERGNAGDPIRSCAASAPPR